MTGRYPHLASVVSGQAVRAAMAMEDFLAEAPVYGLSREEALTVLREANEWALARAGDALARAREVAQEWGGPTPS